MKKNYPPRADRESALREIISRVPKKDAAYFIYRNAMRVAPSWFEQQDTNEIGDLTIVWHLFHASALFLDNMSRKGSQDMAPMWPSNYFPYPHASDAAALLEEAVRLMKADEPRDADTYSADFIYSALWVGSTGDEPPVTTENDPFILANEQDLEAIDSDPNWFKAPIWPNGKPLPHHEAVLERLSGRGLYWPTVVEWYRNLVAGVSPPKLLIEELRTVGQRSSAEDDIREAFIRQWIRENDAGLNDKNALLSEVRRLRSEIAELRGVGYKFGLPGIGHNHPPEDLERNEERPLEEIDIRLEEAEVVLQGDTEDLGKLAKIGADLVVLAEKALRVVARYTLAGGALFLGSAIKQAGSRAGDDIYVTVLGNVVEIAKNLIQASVGL
ncbi:hypothetical protein ACIPCF_07595 [Paracoccus marcusii]|uniref:hypothetical protein n=1 Tax=Paracoccus marcusii TaxID=59779 RepID=UPI0038B82459